MSAKSRPNQSVRVYARITPELFTLLQQVRVAKRMNHDADVVRAALRAYLDTQSDQVASKRHFTASFQRRINQLDWHLTVLTYLQAQSLAMLIVHATGQKITADVLLEQAVRLSVQQQKRLAEQLDESYTRMDEMRRKTR